MSTVTDPFTRADSTTSIGTAPTGQSWVNRNGTWGISSNRAYVDAVPGDWQATADVDASESDGTVQVTVAVVAGDEGFIFRVQSGTNYLMATVDNRFSSGATIYEQVAGAFTALGTAAATIADGDVLSMVLSGTSIDFKKNGVSMVSVSSTRFQTETKHGMRTYTHSGINTARFDDFSFTGSGGAAAPPNMSFLFRLDRQRALRGRRLARSNRTRRQV